MSAMDTRPLPPNHGHTPLPGSRPGWPPPPPPSAPPHGGTPPQKPQRRGPGWLALVVAVAVTALLAAGLALAGVRALDDDTQAAAAPSSSAQVQPPVPSGGDSTGPDWTAVAAAASKSVVTIQVQGQRGGGEGSGVVIDDRGNILTNNHVVSGAGSGADIRVVLSDGRMFTDVEVVGLDPTTDLAVLRITDPPSDLAPATLGDSSKVLPGQPVMAVGNPLGLSDTVTTGIVSAIDRPVTTQVEGANPLQQGSAEPVVTNAIQTDAAINPGNSGGALVDATGTVIGINSSIATTGGGSTGNIGVGFAIPINEAKRIAEALIGDGSAEHAVLGVSLQDGAGTVQGVLRQAAVVVQVVDGSPADQAGLRRGDAITAVDDEAITGAESLTAQIRERPPGTEVTLTVVRDGNASQVPVTLGTRQNG